MSLSLSSAAHSAPLRPLVERWVAERRGLGYADTKRDESAVNEMLASLGWSDVVDINAADFRAYLAEQSTPGSVRLAGRRAWHPRTRNKMQSHMSAFIRYLIDVGATPGPNWVLQIPRAKEREPGEGKTPLTPVQFWALHARTIARGGADRAAVYLAFWRTGMRPSDYEGLERRSLTDGKETAVPVLLVRRTKTDRARAIPLAPDVAEWFRAQARNKSPRERLLPPMPDPKVLKMDLAAAGLDETEFGYSSFRKGFACDRALAGAPLEVVQKTLGHTTSRTTTEHYQRFSGSQLAEGLGFAHAAENSGGKTLDSGGISSETNPVTSMNRSPRTSHDDSARASASGMDVTIQASGVEARADSPCVSGPGIQIPGSWITKASLYQSELRWREAATVGRSSAGDDSPTGHILILAERAVSGVVAAERSGRSAEFVGRVASVAMNAMEALGLHLNRKPVVPTA